MPYYYWLPQPDKKPALWDSRMYSICEAQHRFVLPRRRPDGTLEWPAVDPDAKKQWTDILAGDTIAIVAHGSERSTRRVGWTGEPPAHNLIAWDVPRLVTELRSFLLHRRTTYLNYELIVCWGANGVLGGSMGSFGSNLATAMGNSGFKGHVHAFRGMILLSSTKEFTVRGRGRWTSQFHEHNEAGFEQVMVNLINGDQPLPLNHFRASTKRVSWRIP